MDKIFRLKFRGKEFVGSTKGTDTLQILVSTSNKEYPAQLSMSSHGDYSNRDVPTEQKTWLIESLANGDSFTFEYDNSAKPTEPMKTEETGPYVEHCAFCGKHKKDVELLIEGNKFLTAHICNECVDECVKVISARRNEHS